MSSVPEYDLFWQDDHYQLLRSYLQIIDGQQAKKGISWINKYRSFFVKDIFHIKFTEVDTTAFKVSALGQKFISDLEIFNGLLYPKMIMPQKLASFLNEQPLWKKEIEYLANHVPIREKIIWSHLEKLVKNGGCCFGQSLTLSKHLITFGGSIAKLKAENLDKIELIFFQLSQFTYFWCDPPLAKSYFELVWEGILKKRQKKSRSQKFLLEDEPKLENVRWDYSPLIEKSSELFKSLFFQFPKSLINEKLAPEKGKEFIDNDKLKSFFIKSIRAQGAVTYMITVVDHNMLLHCNEKTKTFELYDFSFAGLLSFESREKAVEATLELSETKKSLITKVYMLYQLNVSKHEEEDSEIFIV